MEITHINDDKTIRVVKRFHDREGAYAWVLEKLSPALPSPRWIRWLWKGFPEEWYDGSRHLPKYGIRIPPVQTYDIAVRDAWISYYDLKPVQ